MKICPKCYAEYEDSEVERDRCYCIECYGDSLDVDVVDLDSFLAEAKLQELLAKRSVLDGLTCPRSSKRVILRRLDRVISRLRH